MIPSKSEPSSSPKTCCIGLPSVWWSPPPPRTNYDVKVVVRRVEGWSDQVLQGAQKEAGEHQKLAVEVRWSGSTKVHLMRRSRRSVKRDCTKETVRRNDGVFEWEEEFQNECGLSPCRDDCNVFQPREITFALLDGSKPGPKNKTHALATGSINLAEYASMTLQKKGFEFELSIPLTLSNSAVLPHPSLHCRCCLAWWNREQPPQLLVIHNRNHQSLHCLLNNNFNMTILLWVAGKGRKL